MFEPMPEEEKEEISCLLTLTNFPLAFQELKRLQGQDPDLVEIRSKLLQGQKIEKYLLSKDILYWCSARGRCRKIVVPTVVRDMIFSYFHESPLGGHLGMAKTLVKI